MTPKTAPTVYSRRQIVPLRTPVEKVVRQNLFRESILAAWDRIARKLDAGSGLSGLAHVAGGALYHLLFPHDGTRAVKRRVQG